MSPIRRDEALDRRHHVEPSVSPARDDENWEAIVAKRAAPPKGWVGRWSALAAAAVLLLGVWWGLRPEPDPSAWNGTTVATAAEPLEVSLQDGSRIEAAPHSRIELVEGRRSVLRVALRRGAARFDVVPDRGRDFVVEAGPVTVRVVGTRFRVARASGTPEVTVTVEQGRVEVRVEGERRVLGAGESWSRVPPNEAPTPQPARADAPEPEPEVERRSPRAGPPPRPAASELFERASAARRDGDPAAAAEAYGSLVSNHPRDARAPLAAFELGRLRMDDLGDPAGAVVALERSLALAPRSPFREDALARIARALDAAGRVCTAAGDRYLSEYPNGRWAEDVARRCGD